jgi:hypothetical protein
MRVCHEEMHGSNGFVKSCILLSIYGSTARVGLLGRGISPSEGHYLQKHNKRTQTSTPQVGFEPMIPVFERTKTVHALDRAATVIGVFYFS